jgi:hypothetical protein
VRLYSSLLLVLLTLGCGVSATGTDDEALGKRTQAFDQARHEYVTRVAVEAWVNEETATALTAVSTIGDSDPATHLRSEAHFDNCYWNEGRDFLLAKREAAVAAAVRFAESASNADKQECFDSLGYVLHAAQDHYAHSNWVETHEPGELAPLDVPDEPPPEGWISGTFDNADDSGPDAGALHCPPGTPSHDELNKDGTGSLEADEAFLDATQATTDQLAKLVQALHEAAPDDAERVLGDFGFLDAPATTVAREDAGEILVSESGPFGFETPTLYCPEGSYAAGFSQRVELAQGDEDDTGLNAVVLHCRNPSGGAFQRLSAWEGIWGEWSEAAPCPAGELITEAQLKLAGPESDDDDDSAASAVRFGCSDGTTLLADNDADAGAWGEVLACPNDSAICGLSIRYQPPQDDLDDTAMNAIRLQCCSVPGMMRGAGDAGGLSALPMERPTAPEPSGGCSVGRALAPPRSVGTQSHVGCIMLGLLLTWARSRKRAQSETRPTLAS